MSATFPKTDRIVEKKDYARVFDQAGRIVANTLVLLYRGNSLAHCRLGLAISKKHVAKAVRRNRIRRLIREFFRLRKNQCSGLDIVFLSRPVLGQAEEAAMLRNLEELWRKLMQRCAD
jgi:ribonuclease P protein component